MWIDPAKRFFDLDELALHGHWSRKSAIVDGRNLCFAPYDARPGALQERGHARQ